MRSPYEIARALRRGLRGQLPDPPVTARHAEWSIISSADDLYVRPTHELVDILLRAADTARTLQLTDVAARCRSPREAEWIDLWPGEHYRLLPALARALDARVAVEVGTFQGPGALALLAGLPADGRVITYDVVPWQKVDDTILQESDFGPRLEQRLGDLSDPVYLEGQIPTLLDADLIFVDGPKDGVFEDRFCRDVLPRLADRPRLVVFDDIRRVNMVQLWRSLPYAKLDATSLGHWSGTGLLLTRWDGDQA